MLTCFTLDTEVEFTSSSYIGSESLKGVPVALVITKGALSIGETIVVNIVATSHFPISAEGTYIAMHILLQSTCMSICNYVYYIHMAKNITFSYIATHIVIVYIPLYACSYQPAY